MTLLHIIICFYVILGADVIDHVPVDDNPAYITRITLNKNSAYETVNIVRDHHNS